MLLLKACITACGQEACLVGDTVILPACNKHIKTNATGFAAPHVCTTWQAGAVCQAALVAQQDCKTPGFCHGQPHAFTGRKCHTDKMQGGGVYSMRMSWACVRESNSETRLPFSKIVHITWQYFAKHDTTYCCYTSACCDRH